MKNPFEAGVFVSNRQENTLKNENKPESAKKKTIENAKIAVRLLFETEGAIHSPGIEEAVKQDSTHDNAFGQIDADLEIMKAKVLGQVATESDFDDFKRRLFKLSQNNLNKSEYRASNFYKKCADFFIDLGRFDVALWMAENLCSQLRLSREIKQQVIKGAVRKQQFEIARSLIKKGESKDSMEMNDIAEECLAIVAKDSENGKYDAELIDKTIEIASRQKLGTALQCMTSVAGIQQRAGKDPTEIVKMIKSKIDSSSDQDKKLCWIWDMDEQPFDPIEIGKNFNPCDTDPYAATRIVIEFITLGPDDHAFASLLKEGVIIPTETVLGSADSPFRQGWLAYYKNINGLDPKENIEAARVAIASKCKRISSYPAEDRLKASFVAMLCSIGDIAGAEKAFANMKNEKEKGKKFSSDLEIEPVSNIVCYCELANAYFKQRDDETARARLEAARKCFLETDFRDKYRNSHGEELIKSTFRLAEAMKAQGENPTAVMMKVVNEQGLSYKENRDEIILEKSRNLGLDLEQFLDVIEKRRREISKNNNELYDQLRHVMKLRKKFGLSNDNLLIEVNKIRQKTRAEKVNSATESVAAFTEPYGVSEADFYRRYKKALESGKYRLVWQALNQSFDGNNISKREKEIAQLIGKLRKNERMAMEIFDAAIKAEDYDFARKVAYQFTEVFPERVVHRDPSTTVPRETIYGGVLRGKIAAYDAIRSGDFSILEEWLKKDAVFNESDLRPDNKRKAAQGSEIGKFTGRLEDLFGNTERFNRVQSTTERRIKMLTMLFSQLGPDIALLGEKDKEEIFKISEQEKIMSGLKAELEMLGIKKMVPWPEINSAYLKLGRKMTALDQTFSDEQKDKGITMEDIKSAYNKIKNEYKKRGLMPNS